ncbi:tetratricopeptide repeat protein [Actinophytocola sediminis]
MNPDTFQRYVGHVRKGLRQLDPELDVRNKSGTLRLDVDREEIDYWWLQGAVERGGELLEAGEYGDAYQLLRQAGQLWTPQPFADLHGEPAEYRRWQAESAIWVPAYDVLLRALDGLGRSQDVLNRLDNLPFEHRGHYRLAVQRVKALYAVGRQRDALSYVQQARHHLLENDEIDAADELLRQHDLIRQHIDAAAPITLSGNGSRPPSRLTPDLLQQDVDFVGRVDLLESLRELTSATDEPARGVVIVHGPPGVGKTALVIHWAHQVRHRFPGGVLFANLSGFSDRSVVDPVLVVDDFLIALGHAPDQMSNPRAKVLLLSRLLAERPTLVILDNVRDNEHVRDLVPRMANSQVIVTSRLRLTTLGTTVGARRVAVGRMTAAEADDLLSIQLGEQRQLAAADRARLVERCGGLPVAISVATAYAATCPPEAIIEFASQLTARQLVVDLGDQDGTVNVGGLFAQSYDALDEPARRLFRLIGLHPGPDIDIGALRAGDDRGDQETSWSLAKLVDAHLVEQPALGRYRLHDLLAEFALFCAETEESAEHRHAAAERMIRYYAATVTNAAKASFAAYIPPPATVGLSLRSIEFSTRAHAQSWFYQERQNLIAIVVYSVHNGHCGYTYQLGEPAATFCDRMGAYRDSMRIRGLILEATAVTGDREGRTSALIGFAMNQLHLGELGGARRDLEVALRIATEDNLIRGRSAALHHLGRLEMLRGDPAAALRLWRKGLSIADQNDDDEGRCWYQCRIGEALRVIDRHEESYIQLSEARRIAERIDENSAHAAVLTQLGHLLIDTGDSSGAAMHLGHARRLAEEIPDKPAIAQACVALAELDFARGRTGSGLTTIRLALDLCRQSGNLPVEAQALAVLGALRHASGEVEAAVSAWRGAIDLYHRMGNLSRVASLHDRVRELSPSQVVIPEARPSDAQLGSSETGELNY